MCGFMLIFIEKTFVYKKAQKVGLSFGHCGNCYKSNLDILDPLC